MKDNYRLVEDNGYCTLYHNGTPVLSGSKEFFDKLVKHPVVKQKYLGNINNV